MQIDAAKMALPSAYWKGIAFPRRIDGASEAARKAL